MSAIEPRHYVVQIILHVDGYEKVTVHTGLANDELDAVERAVAAEAHNDIEVVEVGQRYLDDHMIYEIHDAKEIPADEYATISKYIVSW